VHVLVFVSYSIIVVLVFYLMLVWLWNVICYIQADIQFAEI